MSQEFLGHDIIWGGLKKHERAGRPLGGNGFINRLEVKTGRVFRLKRLKGED
jgi:hypothetical protein